VRSVTLFDSAVEEIRAHARETYPDECCGFLLAGPDPTEPESPRVILTARRAANDVDGDPRRRFVIRAEELRRAERSAEATGHFVVGFYHSHPDHPARPSAFDESHAWPWYTYVVLEVTPTETPALGAFELDAESAQFREVALAVVPSGGPAVSESLRAPEAR
jgi:proteasome lid subunit RPN8/RPN11